MIEGSSTAYLAVAGGFALPPFMGSLSTYARAGVGGFEGRKLAAGDALPLVARAGAAGRREQARPALRLRQRADPHRLGAAGRLFQRARPPHLRRVRLPRLQGSRSHGHPLRGPDHRACRPSTRAAPTSSPTASGPAPSRCRAPACRSCCWATGRPWAAIPRSPPWPRSTCRGWAACCRARRSASPPSRSKRPSSCAASRRRGSRAPSPSFHAARPPGGIDLARLYEENLIDGIVYERDHASR